jgi:hypothetical protein
MADGVWVVLLVVALAAGAGAAWFFLRQQRSRRLRDRFGPEYDHSVRQLGDRGDAERELERRQERVDHLEIRSLPLDDRQRYADEWRRVQARFVDDPPRSIGEADRLVAEVMRARGYPVTDFHQRAADISVDHPRVVEHYRAAHAIARRNDRGEASTEDLRQAMVHYRTLFEDLLEGESTREKEKQA